MDKVELPRGLIRYANEESIAEEKPHVYSTRAKAYTAVLVILLVIMGFLTSSRPIVDATILRASGMTHFEQEGKIVNLYSYKILNKSGQAQQLEMRLIEPEGGTIEYAGTPVMTVKVGEFATGSFFVKVLPNSLKTSETQVRIGIFANGELVETVKTSFNGPRIKTKL